MFGPKLLDPFEAGGYYLECVAKEEGQASGAGPAQEPVFSDHYLEWSKKIQF